MALIAALLLSGCSSFHRDFRAASSKPADINAIGGAWDGAWKSDVNGHHGRLRCLIQPIDAGTVQARFRATWARVFSFEYRVPLQVSTGQVPVLFKGEANLGRLAGGVYQYEGQVMSNRFTSSYRCRSDHGTFEMMRAADSTPVVR